MSCASLATWSCLAAFSRGSIQAPWLDIESRFPRGPHVRQRRTPNGFSQIRHADRKAFGEFSVLGVRLARFPLRTRRPATRPAASGNRPERYDTVGFAYPSHQAL